MEQINSSAQLKEAILQLEQQHTLDEHLVKEQFLLAYESMKPINLIKNTIEQVSASQELKDNLTSSAIGLGVGYVSKLAFVGFSHSPLRKIMGAALMYGVSNFVAKHPEKVRAAASVAFMLLKKVASKSVNTVTKTEN
jgi:hypothetical protein